MKIAREKMAATWPVVKGSTPTEAIPYETLERYRPLFKYLNGKEMAKLNLSDSRILSYIGTHPDLSRHQVFTACVLVGLPLSHTYVLNYLHLR